MTELELLEACRDAEPTAEEIHILRELLKRHLWLRETRPARALRSAGGGDLSTEVDALVRVGLEDYLDATHFGPILFGACFLAARRGADDGTLLRALFRAYLYGVHLTRALAPYCARAGLRPTAYLGCAAAAVFFAEAAGLGGPAVRNAAALALSSAGGLATSIGDEGDEWLLQPGLAAALAEVCARAATRVAHVHPRPFTALLPEAPRLTMQRDLFAELSLKRFAAHVSLQPVLRAALTLHDRIRSGTGPAGPEAITVRLVVPDAEADRLRRVDALRSRGSGPLFSWCRGLVASVVLTGDTRAVDTPPVTALAERTRLEFVASGESAVEVAVPGRGSIAAVAPHPAAFRAANGQSDFLSRWSEVYGVGAERLARIAEAADGFPRGRSLTALEAEVSTGEA